MGLYGSWKFKGLTSLGVITFDESCAVKDGVYKEPGEEDVEVKIVERIKYITIQGEDVVDPVPLIILTVFFLVTIAIIIYVCMWCIRRERKKFADFEQKQQGKVSPAPWG